MRADAVVIMVPGLGLGPDAWAPTVSALGERGVDRGRTQLVPLPGYGLSAGRHEDLTPAGLARRLTDECLSPGRVVVLVGHSASCQVVAHAARLAGGRVAGLVLVGPTTDPRAHRWRHLAGRWLGTARHEPPWQVPTLLRQYIRTGPATMVRAMEEARKDRIDQTLREVDCPVLVVRGIADRITSPDWAERLVAGRSDAASVTLEAGGHMVPLTHPMLVASAVAPLVQRLHGRGT